MTKLKWLVAAAAAAVVLVVGGTWVYINVIREDAPPPLALDQVDTEDATSTTGRPIDAGDDAAGQGVEGTWTVTDGSIVGYRVEEILFGQSAEAVGRTSAVEGTLAVEGTTVTAAEFSVDVATIESDESRRDGQFRGRIMDVATFPTATLELVEPIELDDAPTEGATVATTATVALTLRGVTREVPMDLEARHQGDRVEIVGSLLVVFDEWEIPNPSRPGIETADEGLLEALLVLVRA